MQYLNSLLQLLAKTDTRDQILRLAQYGLVHAEDHLVKGATFNAYIQIRHTRKWLRFLRVIEYVRSLRRDFGKLSESHSLPYTFLKILTILEGVFRILFFLFDHQVALGQLQLIPKGQVTTFYPKSMKMYLFQNIAGAVKNTLELVILIRKGTLEEGWAEEESLSKGEQLVRSKSIEFLRNLLDIFVAWYYINKPANLASRVGIVGMLTSLIALAQSLKLI